MKYFKLAVLKKKCYKDAKRRFRGVVLVSSQEGRKCLPFFFKRQVTTI